MPPIPGPFDSEFSYCLAGARQGDEASWRTLYDWLAPQLLGFFRACRLADSEDVLGEVFLEVARRIGGFRGDARGFRAWVFTIARARRVDEIRRQVRRVETPLDPTVEARLSSGSDVEGEVLALMGLDDLLGVLEELTDDQSEVMVLRALGGWTSAEVATITGRSVGAVEQLQHRAVIRLRQLLGA